MFRLTNMIEHMIKSLRSPTKNIVARIYNEKTKLRPDMIEERAILGSDRCLDQTKSFRYLN